ncbi:MAG: 50S ribosomal protein L22 [Candidatus Micrarchaeia archaeon]|jgi:ribosomal protein uL22
MGLYKYSVKVDDKAKVGQAQGYDLDISYKDLCNVCAALRHRNVAKARTILNEAIELKIPILFKKFNTGVGHRSQLGGRKGRFPKKECKAALAVLNNAVANATKKGLDEKLLFVKNACAYKQNVLPRYRRTWVGGAALGYGKQAIRSDYVTARMEITVEERPALPGKAKNKAAARKAAQKPAGAKPEAKAEKKADKPAVAPAAAKAENKGA